MAEIRQILLKIFIDGLSLFLVFLPWIVLKLTATPFHRGFFCDDESLQYPFHDSTVTTPMYVSVCFVVNLVAIVIVEGVHSYVMPRRKNLPFQHYDIGSHKIPTFLVAVYKASGMFLFGLAVTESVTNIAKFQAGRLRPHFFDVCQPNFTAIKCKDEEGLSLYVTDFECLGPNQERFAELRLSFPSGHTSFTTFSAIFFSLYLQARFTWKGSKLLKHLLQALAMYLALYVALSRISDYKHHWSDVLGGFVIGAAVSLVVGLWIAEFFQGIQLKKLAREISEVIESFRETDGRLKQIDGSAEAITLNDRNF